MAGRFTRQELEEAFAGYQRTSLAAGGSGNWDLFADQFTLDATYVEHGYGTFGGREAIRRWITTTMATFPGSAMPHFPIGWYVVDEDKGWIVCQVFNRMADPGDGSVHQADNITLLKYAGDGLWSYEEDAYNPASFLTMLTAWRDRADRHGTLTEEARTWFASMGLAAKG
ncbi:hypothetical protein [Actinocorallia longicatena]|uniref:Nuclear transport factor 2 family protein n=1 Tax=Actinocorallia longicatena TaxID=111803 RepID=A0ABP6QEK6_9ACTN